MFWKVLVWNSTVF